MAINALESSIPANNEKIIELYNKVKSAQLDTSPQFQRKLVWKKQHKIKFIETILMNFPFPEVYKAPGELNVDTLALTDVVVDGQQRITTIVDFIDSHDVFALEKTPIKFNSLNDEQKKNFLNYEVSVRYLKNATKEQIQEIFQRINDTEYRLNSTERLNAQWGDSEFVHYSKQILEDSSEYQFNPELYSYNLAPEIRTIFNNFFENNNIFTKNDNSRMLALQWILALIATIEEDKYFRRYDKVQSYVELYNDEFDNADEVTEQLLKVINTIEAIQIDPKSYLFNKANIFTLLVELYKYNQDDLNLESLKEQLVNLETIYNNFTKPSDEPQSIEQKYIDYFEHARDSQNEVSARKYRAEIITEFIEKSFQN